jgi:hypothetical protein
MVITGEDNRIDNNLTPNLCGFQDSLVLSDNWR